jgi:endonuclease YncB( thermonuclease family)
MGTLKISGTINLSQFWPTGNSDADTTKLKINVTPNSFKFNGKVTDKYFGATVKGKATKKVISAKNEVTIRLQGIDAPELHYKFYGPLGKAIRSALPPKFRSLTATEFDKIKELNKNEYRQLFGETATVKLFQLLNPANNITSLNCEFVSNNITKPSDVADTYGRFVGDIFVKIKGKKVNLNQWLLENGWAFPSIYNSMSFSEINNVVKAGKTGRNKKQNDIYSAFNPQTIKESIDFTLTKRQKAKDGTLPVIKVERGQVLYPKLFRRLTYYSMFKKAGITDVGKKFIDYLSVKPDKGLYLTSDFLVKANHEVKDSILLRPAFLKKFNQQIINDKFQLQPDEIVFLEDESKLFDSNDKEITSF